MRNVTNYIAVEWKLMFRGYGIWIILMGLLVIFYMVSTEAYYDSDLGFKAMHTLMLLLPLFISLFFLAMFAARREATTKRQYLLGSLPYKTREVVVSKLLALALPFTLFQLMPAILYLILAVRTGFSFNELKTGLYILLASVIPGWFILLVGYLIGSITRKRVGYLMGIVVFISLIYGVNLFITKFASYLDIIDFTQLDLFGGRQPTIVYSRIWGFTTDMTHWVHRIFYLSLIIGLLMSYIHRRASKRKEQVSKYNYYIATSVISVLLLLSLYAYTAVWQGREQAYNQEVSLYKSAKLPSDSNAFEHIEASDYQLDVKTSSNHQLDVTAQFLITNHTGTKQERFPLTLRHSFQIQEVRINDQNAPAFSRDQEDVVWITPPQSFMDGESIKVKLVYSGYVDEWLHLPKNSGNKLSRFVFVDPDRMNLLGVYGWYPLGGIHQLAAYVRNNVPGYGDKSYLQEAAFHVPLSDFKVTVHTINRMDLFSNGTLTSEKDGLNDHEVTFIAKQASGLSIVGGALHSVERTVGDTTFRLVASKQMQTKQLESNLKSLAETSLQLQDELEVIWGRKVNDPLVANGTFMIADENDPFRNNRNGLKLLPLEITRDFTNKKEMIRWMFTQLMEGEPPISKEMDYLFYDLLTQYLANSSEDKKQSLFPTPSGSIKPNPLHVLIDNIYRTATEEEFRTFIRDLYVKLTQVKGSYEQAKQQIQTFLTARAESRS